MNNFKKKFQLFQQRGFNLENLIVEPSEWAQTKNWLIRDKNNKFSCRTCQTPQTETLPVEEKYPLLDALKFCDCWWENAPFEILIINPAINLPQTFTKHVSELVEEYYQFHQETRKPLKANYQQIYTLASKILELEKKFDTGVGFRQKWWKTVVDENTEKITQMRQKLNELNTEDIVAYYVEQKYQNKIFKTVELLNQLEKETKNKKLQKTRQTLLEDLQKEIKEETIKETDQQPYYLIDTQGEAPVENIIFGLNEENFLITAPKVVVENSKLKDLQNKNPKSFLKLSQPLTNEQKEIASALYQPYDYTHHYHQLEHVHQAIMNL